MPSAHPIVKGAVGLEVSEVNSDETWAPLTYIVIVPELLVTARLYHWLRFGVNGYWAKKHGATVPAWHAMVGLLGSRFYT